MRQFSYTETGAGNYQLLLADTIFLTRPAITDPPEIREDFARQEALMEASGMNDPDYKFHGKPKRLTSDELARI